MNTRAHVSRFSAQSRFSARRRPLGGSRPSAWVRLFAALLCGTVFCSPLLCGSAARADNLWTRLDDAFGSPQTPHPAVVRVIVPEGNSSSLGSGTLVDANQSYGLVITNWHVVRDHQGDIFVRFPDGFRSPARLLKVDSQWDLAALLIERPNVSAVPLAATAPRPGELLTIAGYGSGKYRAASGQCTQYVAPSVKAPFEMLELAATARQGDSGGPIFNSRGELAGVLFGAGGGRTAGSYCGRVRHFLTSIDPQIAESLAAKSRASSGMAAGSVPASGASQSQFSMASHEQSQQPAASSDGFRAVSNPAHYSLQARHNTAATGGPSATGSRPLQIDRLPEVNGAANFAAHSTPAAYAALTTPAPVANGANDPWTASGHAREAWTASHTVATTSTAGAWGHEAHGAWASEGGGMSSRTTDNLVSTGNLNSPSNPGSTTGNSAVSSDALVIDWKAFIGRSRLEQIKSSLSLVGALALVLHALAWLRNPE